MSQSTKVPYFYVVGGIMGLLAIASLWIFPSAQEWRQVIVVFWLVIPPTFFFFELHLVRKHNPKELDNCKLSQESASKIWAGVAAALVLIYFK